MKLINEALAGTLESNDLFVKISPNDGPLEVSVTSEVERQFGARVRELVGEILKKFEVESGSVVIQDKGALDCVIRARLEAAVIRAAGKTAQDWVKLQ